MNNLIVLITTGDLLAVKNYIKNNNIDINESIRIPKVNSTLKINTRPIDVAWNHFVQYRNTDSVASVKYEAILELLMNENSMYPQPFDVNMLSRESKIRKLFELSLQLHKAPPQQALQIILKYPHLYYFFDQYNKSLLFAFWENKEIPFDVSKRLLLSPNEYFILDREKVATTNLLLKLKSLIRIRTTFNNKAKKQSICCDINDIFINVSDFMVLSAVVMYPTPISIIFDYTETTPFTRFGVTFVVGCKARKCIDVDQLVNCISNELFGIQIRADTFKEFISILKLNVDIDQLRYFKDIINNKIVQFHGRSVRFGDIKPIVPPERRLMYRIMFDKQCVPFGVSPPAPGYHDIIDVGDILNNKLRYSTIKFVVGFHEHALFEIYYTLRERRPPTWWLWYIDVSMLSLDQHCTANTILTSAYIAKTKGDTASKYGWQIFLDLYTKFRTVLIFGGIDKLQPELRKRVMTILNHDLICERWIGTSDICLLSGPKINVYILINCATPATLQKISNLLGTGYECSSYSSGDSTTLVFGKNKIYYTKEFICSIKFPSDTDELCCVQFNYDVFVRFNEDNFNSSEIKIKLESIEAKRYDYITHEIKQIKPTKIIKHTCIANWISK